MLHTRVRPGPQEPLTVALTTRVTADQSACSILTGSSGRLWKADFLVRRDLSCVTVDNQPRVASNLIRTGSARRHQRRPTWVADRMTALDDVAREAGIIRGVAVRLAVIGDEADGDRHVGEVGVGFEEPGELRTLQHGEHIFDAESRRLIWW